MRITLNYPVYLEQFMARSDLSVSYWEQYRLLMSDAFGWADFLERNFGRMGWEVWEPVTNFERNQRQWIEEKGLELVDDANWFLEITRLQIEDFRPTVLFVDSYTAFDAQFLNAVRESVPELRLVVGWCGAPYPDGTIFKAFDITLSNLPNLVESLKAEGLDARLLWHGFELSILERISNDSVFEDRIHEASFTGSVVFGKANHEERLLLLWSLVNGNVPIEVFAILAGVDWSRSLDAKVRVLRAKGIREGLRELKLLGYMRHLKEIVKAPLFGLEMYELLRQSKVSLNNQIGISRGHATNTRMYQVTGCGSCLLTDWKPDLAEKFEIDREVVTYRSPEEAVEKARYLLDNPGVASEIARAGQRRTLESHSFRNRCEQLNEIFQEKL